MVVGCRVKIFITYKCLFSTLFVVQEVYILLLGIYTLLKYVSFKVITSKHKNCCILECVV